MIYYKNDKSYSMTSRKGVHNLYFREILYIFIFSKDF